MSDSGIILPPDSALYHTFLQAAETRRIIFFAGLPGVGKSLLMQQMALIATQVGHTIHSLQWDVTRAAFETAAVLANYPESDGVTHAIIRKAVGLWAREAVWQWRQQADAAQLLLGEVPLVGNRLIELVQPHDDNAEALLAGAETVFLLPVPTGAVRDVIEEARARTIANPQHEKETRDAQPNVLRALFQEVAQIGYSLGLTSVSPTADQPYDAQVYTAVYEQLLQYRRRQTLLIDTVLQPRGSAYKLPVIASELQATSAEVTRIMAQLEQEVGLAAVETAVADWYRF